LFSSCRQKHVVVTWSSAVRSTFAKSTLLLFTAVTYKLLFYAAAGSTHSLGLARWVILLACLSDIGHQFFVLNRPCRHIMRPDSFFRFEVNICFSGQLKNSESDHFDFFVLLTLYQFYCLVGNSNTLAEHT
jgi:hypothetical protein